jgi:hypothetical protein
METEEKARVAVSSRVLASAANVGLSTPPARETGTGDVGFATCAGASTEVIVSATEV